MERSTANQEPSDAVDLAEREREATTKQTLNESLENEKRRNVADEGHDKPPSPDGAFDENRELNDADPV
jgi:hypothetical protein